MIVIRSQDKTKLVQATLIQIHPDDVNNKYAQRIRVVVNKEMLVVANYKSKERALEVIDAIQALLTPITVVPDATSSTLCDPINVEQTIDAWAVPMFTPAQPMVYEMPKE